ncbi:hypothetical protein ACS5NO_28545 [Larkinella sp. GY13]|uniref:hypothetical protein n=1 Tax=Larkinella sp. GY13 TaxID=3453720 RepID=UPI003EEA3568
MSGRKISAVIRYGADTNRRLTLSRVMYWPTLRTIPGPGEPDYAKYRSYLKRSYAADVAPSVTVDGKALEASSLKQVVLDGILTLYHQPNQGLTLTRTLFPSTSRGAFVEHWNLRNTSSRPIQVAVTARRQTEQLTGLYGVYIIETTVIAQPLITLKPGQSLTTGVVFSARLQSEPAITLSPTGEEASRRAFLRAVNTSLVLTTPDALLNRAFAFAKIRASESLFDTKMGLVHSPGGGRYYAGVWTNDQVEYAGPFFPFLGYAPASEASLNAYRLFARLMKPDYGRIWSSLEMEGDFPCCSKDRGDAAMYAYGAARFSLASGNPAIAAELWPAINWALEYGRRHTNAEGVVESKTDEMEGRMPTGTANLSTSALTYGALRSAAHLGRALGRADTALIYDRRADTLRQAIETYFGADIQGFHTYRYFKEHQTLRHWICLPLTMDIPDRKEGTIQALLTRLWTPDGLAVEAGDPQIWDRGTLYALRGILMAGETETGLAYLHAYTRQRLLGNHVPYAVEASPEGGQAHLSAESALYGRIITEGLFGIRPTGLRSFTCVPRLPAAWPQMRLSGMKAFCLDSDVLVMRIRDQIRLVISQQNRVIFDQVGPLGTAFTVEW